MPEKSDTIKLLRQCSSGIETGVQSIDDALKYAHSPDLKDLLNKYKAEHELLRDEVQEHMKECADGNPEELEHHAFSTVMAQTMSRIKVNAELTFNDADTKVAELMAEGCDMGSRTLTRYVNEYDKADKRSKNLAGNIIRIEDELSVRLRKFI